MISKKTAVAIWSAYQEIERGEALLKELETSEFWNRLPDFRDAFGRECGLELGVPMGRDNSQRLYKVAPRIAASVIRSHIAQQQKELSDANECARIELQEAKTI